MDSNLTVITNVVQAWQEFFSLGNSMEGMNDIVDQTQLFNQIQSSNLKIVVFSFSDLSILHVNQGAADIFGASINEIRESGASLIISCFDKKQLEFANKTAILSAPETAKASREDILDSLACYCNWIIYSKKGLVHRNLFRVFPIKVNERGMPLVGMYLIYDVKPFIRSDIWWYRSVLGKNNFMHYQSNGKKLVKKDILSEREKNILVQVADGKTSKEIGQIYHISPHTVDNHRRKMLAKTGMVDTSSLIHVAKLSGILV